MSKTKPNTPDNLAAGDSSPLERWRLSSSAAAFVRERAKRLNTDPVTIIEDVILVERRRVEGAI